GSTVYPLDRCSHSVRILQTLLWRSGMFENRQVANTPRPIRRHILASHLVLTGYGHWHPNDPRGSGSHEIRKTELRPLGRIHFGRKPVQPTKHALRSFHREVEPHLDHPVLW